MEYDVGKLSQLEDWIYTSLNNIFGEDLLHYYYVLYIVYISTRDQKCCAVELMAGHKRWIIVDSPSDQNMNVLSRIG